MGKGEITTLLYSFLPVFISYLINPWKPNFRIKSSGEILSAHCNCMAGLAEVCTHVASLLFWTEISIKIRESSTVTDRAAFWVAPSNPSNLQLQKIQDIYFRAPKRKKREIFCCIQDDQQLDKSKKKKKMLIRDSFLNLPKMNYMNFYWS